MKNKIDFDYFDSCLNNLHEKRDAEARKIIAEIPEKARELNEDFLIDSNTGRNPSYKEYEANHKELCKQTKQEIEDIFAAYKKVTDELFFRQGYKINNKG